MSKNNFVGFGRLEDLIADLKDGPVNVECVTEQEGSKQFAGMTYAKDVIVTSQVQENEVIYHYFVTAKYQMVAGKALAHDDGQSIGKRSEGAYQLVLEILKEAGFSTRRALIAFPRSLKLLEGNTSLLRYKKEGDLFERAVAGEPA